MSSAVGALAAGGAAEALSAAAFGVVEEALDAGHHDSVAGLAEEAVAGGPVGRRGQSVTHCRRGLCGWGLPGRGLGP